MRCFRTSDPDKTAVSRSSSQHLCFFFWTT